MTTNTAKKLPPRHIKVHLVSPPPGQGDSGNSLSFGQLVLSLKESRNTQTSRDLFHLLGHHLLGFSDGLIHRRDN